MKFFLIPFAGGNKYSFNKFIIPKATILEINRNLKITEINTISDNFISEELEQICDVPYVIYGHSLGALLAYLVCQKLQEENLPLPQRLIVSGKKSPSVPRKEKIAHLPDKEFWEEIIALGGIPDEMQNYPELIEYYLPILRHDFKLVESYQYEKKPKLNIPIDVFYGSEEATEEEMIGWQDETTEKITITQLPGNHFFIFDHVEYFRDYFDNLIHQK